jgi:DNA-binding response OmpR family regulator
MGDKKKIVVAEDEPGYLDLFEVALQNAGYEVYPVDNGKKALAVLRKIDNVALLISDVMMPEMDGYHLAQAVTDELGDKAPKILLMTSRETSREKGVATLAGASEFLQKPIDIDTFTAKVKGLIGD